MAVEEISYGGQYYKTFVLEILEPIEVFKKPSTKQRSCFMIESSKHEHITLKNFRAGV